VENTNTQRWQWWNDATCFRALGGVNTEVEDGPPGALPALVVFLFNSALRSLRSRSSSVALAAFIIISIVIVIPGGKKKKKAVLCRTDRSFQLV